MDFNGDVIEEEIFEGGCGPLVGVNELSPPVMPNHKSGSISWYSDPLT